MEINTNKIPPEGLNLEEEVSVSDLDLQTDTVRFGSPLKIVAEISKITNTITVDLVINALIHTNCSRCLAELEINLKKNLRLHYTVNKFSSLLDLEPDIRSEIILDYPLKPLCNSTCKGLCLKCGKNLNEGGCSCGIT